MKEIILHIISWLLAGYFLASGVYLTSWPPSDEFSSAIVSYLVFGIFFLLIPNAAKLSLDKLLSYEKHIDKIQKDVKDFKTETRDTLNTYNSLISAISNTVNQSVTVNLPGHKEKVEAQGS